MKKPAFQFYPGDWRRDSALQSCSLAARGLWLEMMCLMHDGQPYGHLRVGEKLITPPVLARMVGGEAKDISVLLKELKQAGVFSVTKGGVTFSRRMVRDEEIRKKRAAAGEQSEKNPNVPRKKEEEGLPEGYPSRISSDPSLPPSSQPSFGVSPASASALASCKKKEKEPRANGACGFELFWRAYPRKKGKGACAKWWEKHQPDDVLVGTMLAKIDQEKESRQWQKNGGEFIPYPTTWLNQRRWEDEDGSSERRQCKARIKDDGRFFDDCGKPTLEGQQFCSAHLEERHDREHGDTESATAGP